MESKAAEAAAQSVIPSGSNGREKKEKKYKRRDKKRDKKEKKSKKKAAKPANPEFDKKRSQSFAMPVESALPLGHALVEHYISRVEPSLKEAEATLRKIRENLGVQEDDGLEGLLGSLSSQDAFAARLEILKSKLSTTDTIVQVMTQEDRTRRSTASEADGRPSLQLQDSRTKLQLSGSSNGLLSSSQGSPSLSRKSELPTASNGAALATNADADSSAYRQPIPPPAVAALAKSDRKVTGQYTMMPPRDAQAPPRDPTVISLRPVPQDAVVPVSLVKPSEVAGKNAGRFQARSLSRRTAQLYAQYGDNGVEP